jgi:hypothetical protein
MVEWDFGMDEDFSGLTEKEKVNALSKFFLTRISGSERPHPLAYSQESRWSLTMSTAQAAVENHTFAWRLHVPIDPEVLRLAVDLLLARYESLRSVFGVYEGRTVRYVRREFEIPFEHRDRTNATSEEINAEIASEASQPFDLRSGPVLRIRLLTTGINRQALIVTAHHIIADFVSLGIAFRTLANLYTRIAAGLPIESSAETDGYDDFVLWEARRVLGAPGRDALRYWGSRLADGLDFVELPTDRPWTEERAFRDAEYRFTIGSAELDRLRRVAQEEDCTLFVAMLALFKVLIYSYTKQRSISVISPVSTRSQLQFENEVGALSNHLLLRDHLEEHQTFAEFLKQVGQSVWDGMSHQDFPVSLVTKRVRVRGMPRGAVPFPLKFNMPKSQTLKGRLEGSGARPSRLQLALHGFNAELEVLDRRVTGNSELNLAFIELEGGGLGTLQYNIDLFNQSTIRQMAERLLYLLTIVSRDSRVILRDLVLESSAIHS